MMVRKKYSPGATSSPRPSLCQHLRRPVAHALAHHLHDAAARFLDGIARVELDRPVAAHDLPVGAADHGAAHLRTFEAAAGDLHDAALAERRGTHGDDVADLGGQREQEFQAGRVHAQLTVNSSSTVKRRGTMRCSTANCVIVSSALRFASMPSGKGSPTTVGVVGRGLVPGRYAGAALEILQVDRLRGVERAEQVVGQPRLLLEQLVLDHEAVVDRIDAGAAKIVERGVTRIRDQRLDVGRVRFHLADRGIDLLLLQQLGERAAAEARIVHVLRRVEIRHVLVVGRHERDLVQVDTVFGLQDAARPQPGGHRIAAVDPDHAALEVLRRLDAGPGVDRDRPVMEIPGHEHRHRGERQACGPGAQIGGERHFADVVLEAAAHPPHGGNNLLDLDVVRLESPGGGGSFLERLGQPVVAECGRVRLHENAPDPGT